MQDYANYADEVLAQIEADEVEPSEVDMRPFVEDEETVLTPALAEALPDEKIEEYNTRAREKHHRELQDEKREKVDEYDDALSKLRDADTDDTATVTVGEVELTVKTYLSGEIERKFERLQNNRDDAEVQRELIPEVLAWVVESPADYADPDVWRAYAEEFGRDELSLVLMRALEPKMDRAENDEVVRKFRGLADRSSSPPGQ